MSRDTVNGPREPTKKVLSRDTVKTMSRLRTFGGARGIRTPDLFHAMEARYQLRHSPGALTGEDQSRRSEPLEENRRLVRQHCVR